MLNFGPFLVRPISLKPGTRVESSLIQSNSRFLRDLVVLESNCTEKDYLCCEEMTENETSLLSRGLNFCPVPGPINETKLSEELDNFARSLRINDHFGFKEVHCVVVY
jgi:predicted DNA-binding antitoxin AbrB/MazE fold protein